MIVLNTECSVLQLCKYNASKVRRVSGKLLTRLSTVEESKELVSASMLCPFFWFNTADPICL